MPLKMWYFYAVLTKFDRKINPWCLTECVQLVCVPPVLLELKSNTDLCDDSDC